MNLIVDNFILYIIFNKNKYISYKTKVKFEAFSGFDNTY